MKTPPQRQRYLTSLAKEFTTQASRVRDLIGSAHWLSDGHHKEALLTSYLRHHLPNGLLCSRGFVVNHRDELLVSTEQDILIVDTSSVAPLFYQSNILITYPHHVIASVSVKTTLSSKTIEDAVTGLHSLRQACLGITPESMPWCGAFFFDDVTTVQETEEKILTWIANAVAATRTSEKDPPPLNAVATNASMICLVRRAQDTHTESAYRVHGFNGHDLATALFTAHLAEAVSERRHTPPPFLTAALDSYNYEKFNTPPKPIPLASQLPPKRKRRQKKKP